MRIVRVYDDEKCNCCGDCVFNCTGHALSFENGLIAYDETECRYCQSCTSVCDNNAFTFKIKK